MADMTLGVIIGNRDFFPDRLVTEARRVPRRELRVVADFNVEATTQAFGSAGIADDDIAICDSRAGIARALEAGKWVATADAMALMDLPGRMLWRRQPERDPYHYQSTYVGRFSRDIPGLEIVVDEGWARPGRSRIRVISLEDGSLRGAYYTSYPRFAAMADFDGDGLDEMVFPTEGGICDTRGRREVRLTDALPLGGPGAETPMVRVADVCGDGRPEVILFNAEAIQIYTDPLPAPGPRAKPPTTDPALHNFTYY